MELTMNKLVRLYPQVENFLGSIVDSAEFSDLSPAEKAGMIEELGSLFGQRLTSYLESVLDEKTLSEFVTAMANVNDDRQVHARLQSLIPQFDADMQRLCLAFHAEYAVGA